jgi:hypothetical protein
MPYFGDFYIADIESSHIAEYRKIRLHETSLSPFLNNKPFSMFIDIQSKFSWALKVISYRGKDDLISNFDKVILPLAEKKYIEMREKKIKEPQPKFTVTFASGGQNPF